MVRIFCKNTQSFKEFPEGSTLLEISEGFDFDKPWPILGAKVNNVTQGLKYKVYNNLDVEFMDYTCYPGRNIYCRSLCFILCKAVRDIYPDTRISIHRPISKGFFCLLKKTDDISATEEEVRAINARMKEIVAEDLPFRRLSVQTEEAIERFAAMGDEDKVKLLRTSGDIYSNYYTLGDTPDYFYNCLVPSSGYIKVWSLEKYRDGMLLRVPDRHNPENLAPYMEQPKTFECLNEMLKWDRLMGLNTVGDINEAIQAGKASQLIQVAEALQDKRIMRIAENIAERYFSDNGLRMVLITGPTSSGKSVFSKRLCVQLAVCGLHPVTISTDDYFVNRVETPKLPDGSYDFDNFETVAHDAMQEDILKYLDGQRVEVPEYNFVTGIREYNGKSIKMEKGTILLIEGIHALNPALTDKISQDKKYKIFINAITSISLDDHNCIPTSDTRLLRRIVRDFNNGSFSACKTIENWHNVRSAEVKWIYPFQEDADSLFNSSYLIEFAVLRTHAEWILATVPKNSPQFSEANRLLHFLHYFTPVSDKEVPSTSLLRGFIGL